MTLWFKILAIILALGLVAGAAKYVSSRRYQKRVEVLERQHALERERQRISKDMHDEIGMNLTKIAILSELAQKDAATPAHQEKHLQKISETVQATIESMNEIIWMLNPQNNTLDHLAAHLRRNAASCLEMTPLQYSLHFPEETPGYPISAEFRRHIFMATKEALHNIIKHARATQMEMQFISRDHTLEILIKDNGQGFVSGERNLASSGNGLSNMKKRIAEIGGNLEIHSQPQLGTTVRIQAPIKS